MAIYQESQAKQAVRLLLLDACRHLQRGKLTYLGLPAEEALDIRALEPVLENAICVDERKAVLDEGRLSIASIPLRARRFVLSRMWQYLRDRYPSEDLAADVTFLDFYGGGLVNDDPFALELAGLRSYFAKHARHPNKTFVLAWTYMPRDKGPQVYSSACEKIVSADKLKLLRKSSGMWARSVAIRLILQKSFEEHGMLAKVFHHAVYKSVMNAIILLYSKGTDQKCKLSLQDPSVLLTAPVCIYEPGHPVPSIVPFPTL